MLKKVGISLAAATLLMTSAPSAYADVNNALQNICTIVKTNDKSELRKKMKKVQSDYRLKLKDYYGSISCDGHSLIRLAMVNDAVDTGTLLVKKLPKKDLSAPEQDGLTIHSWADQNGLAGSAIANVISERI